MLWLFSYDTTGWKGELHRSFIIKLQTTLDLSIVRFCYIPLNSTQTPWGWQTGQSLSRNHALALSFWDALRILGETKRNSSFYFPPDEASLSLSVVIQISNSAQQVRTVAGRGRSNQRENPKVLFLSEQGINVRFLGRKREWVRRKAGQGGRNLWGESVIIKD